MKATAFADNRAEALVLSIKERQHSLLSDGSATMRHRRTPHRACSSTPFCTSEYLSDGN
jgi:hypothetical protein